jgi:hypothetical protein
VSVRTIADPIAIRQWVVSVGFVLEAEDASGRGSSVDRAMALITADTAIESVLGLLSSRVAEPLQSDGYGAYLARAKNVAKLPDRLVREIGAVHKLRNNAVHSAAEVSAADALRGIVSARELLDTYVPRVLRQTRALGRGTGIGHAVASLIPGHPIAARLEAAQAAIAKGDPKQALEQSAFAFDLVKIYTTPELPSDRWSRRRLRSTTFGSRDPIGQALRPVKEAIEAQDDGLTKVEHWIVPLALGMSPAAFAALSQSLPFVVRTRPPQVQWNDEASPDAATARRSIEAVSLLVLRLWLTDTLRFPQER